MNKLSKLKAYGTTAKPTEVRLGKENFNCRKSYEANGDSGGAAKIHSL